MNTKVTLILGSSSDLTQSKELVDRLNELRIQPGVVVYSADRNISELCRYLGNHSPDLYIAVGGKKLVLPGTIAGNTQVPVLALQTKPEKPYDSAFYPHHLLSSFDTPPGIAYAMFTDTTNLATFAATILGVKYPEYRDVVEFWKLGRAVKNLEANQETPEIRHGSNKDLKILKSPTEAKMGMGELRPNDKFSIFDYKLIGEFGFEIPYQGIALAATNNQGYQVLEENEVPTCFIAPLEDCSGVYVVRVPGRELPLEPEKTPVGTPNRLVDLEVTFNVRIHEKSSLLREFKSGKRDFHDYGFDEMPEHGDVIPLAEEGMPPLKFTTKFDTRGDLSLTESEAMGRSRLTEEQWDEGLDMTRRAILAIDDYVEARGIHRFDGKFEWMVDDKGRVRIADDPTNPYNDRYVIDVSVGKILSVVDSFFSQTLSDVYYAKHFSKFSKIRSQFERSDSGIIILRDVSKQVVRDWYEDNGWKALYDKFKNEPEKVPQPPQMPQITIDTYSEVTPSFNKQFGGKDLSKVIHRKIRPLEEIAADLFVLEQLNKEGVFGRV